jgi:hypothetical protein
MRWFISVMVLTACSSGDAQAPAVDARLGDATLDPCQACRSDQICIARFDGNCTRHMVCAAETVACPQNACSTDCETAYCTSSYQCQTRSACGTEPPEAFTCYGP